MCRYSWCDTVSEVGPRIGRGARLTKHVAGVATISEVGPDIGNRDSDLVCRMLRLQPSQRPSMAEVVDDPFFTRANGGGGDGGGESNKKQNLVYAISHPVYYPELQ